MMSEPPSKKQRVAQKYREEYAKTWPFITKSPQGESYARCTICCSDIKVSSGGSNEISRHVQTPKHKKAAQTQQNSAPLKTFFQHVKSRDEDDLQVIRAETLFANAIVEHNLPIALADHMSELFAQMFPDSQIAKKYAAGRTKTRGIIQVLADQAESSLTEDIKRKPFSIATDGSNDKGSEQLYPLVIRYHNGMKVVTDCLTITTTEGPSTGENIFLAMDKELSTRGISWDNCISFGCDNASVMLGRLNGVSAHVLKKNPAVHVQGCPCHLLHLAAKKGASALHVNVEEALIDIFYYLENSTKRMKSFARFQEEAGTSMRKILKHGPTRWLSLVGCIKRLLEQWEPLLAFFAEEVKAKKTATDKADRAVRAHAFLKTPSSKLYALFLSYALPVFTEANVFFQKEDPVLHLMQSRLHDVVTDLLVRFVRPSAITKAENIFEIEHGRRSKQKDREDLMIGEGTRTYLDSCKADGSLSNTVQTQFFEDARSFYSSSLDYVFSKLPVQDPSC